MERHVRQPCDLKAPLVSSYRYDNVKDVFVQNDGNQIQAFGEVLITCFVDMQVESLQWLTPENKCGEVRTSPLWNLQGLTLSVAAIYHAAR